MVKKEKGIIVQDYPWYGEADKGSVLQQGDILYSCPIVEPTTNVDESKEELTADITEYDVIVMSQSCDLAAEKIDLVLLCPFFKLDDIYQEKGTGEKEKLRRGEVAGLHLLDKNSLLKEAQDFFVVNFKSVYAVPISYLKKMILVQDKRYRLLPPYREHLAQAFARFFMRVGLPIDIPEFK